MTSRGISADHLPDVVRGRDPTFARAEAMALLAASQHPDREALLAEVLDNPQEPRRYQLVAAITLGRIATKAAEVVLLRNLYSGHPAVREVLQSLGRIGGREALAAIDELELPSDHPARGDATFAASLIHYRQRLEGRPLPLPSAKELLDPPRKDSLPIEMRRLDEDRARSVGDELEQYPHAGVVLDPASATLIECAGEVNVLLVNREISRAKTAAAVLERPALLAIGALQSPETGAYSPSYLVLTNPARSGEVEVVVTRCSGRHALAGTARPEADGFAFELRSVRRAGARAISVKGAFRDGAVHDVEARSSLRLEPRKQARYRVVE